MSNEFKSLPKSFQDLLFIVPLSAFFLLFDLGKGSLASWDEGLYAGVAKEMVLSGDWLKLTWSGAPWTDKPPLAIWATAVFYKIFGISEFSARFFSALCGIGTVVVTYLIGRKLLNRWTGFLGALVLLSSSHFLRFARFGMLDAPIAFFISIALYFFWLGREKEHYLVWSGVALGLAFMTKSLAALLVFPVVGLYSWWSGESAILRSRAYLAGLLVAALLALPWHLYMLSHAGWPFFHELFVKHLFLRPTTALDGHAGNYYFYIRTLVNKYHPWVLVGIFSAPFFLFKAVRERLNEIQFLAVWMFSMFLVITLMKTKLAWYLLPVYPALSISVGYVLARVFEERYKNFVRLLFLVIMALHVPYSHLFHHDYSRPIKGIASAVSSVVPAGSSLYLYNYHEAPAVAFYLGRKTGYLDDDNAFFAAAEASQKDFYCLIFRKDLDRFAGRLPGLGISVKGGFEDSRLLVGKAGRAGKSP
ncbi:MAG: glycosyltransferase family 39 protein [Candidatus Omnitrophica bacterium]|nr:glycosyltransferase family 39 protein [Candidatus Omnitrophota bacterium]